MEEQYTKDLREDLYNMTKSNIVVELGNGQRLPVENYYHGEDKKGNTVIVLRTKVGKGAQL